MDFGTMMGATGLQIGGQLLGGYLSDRASAKAADEARFAQTMMMKNQIQTRVKDAKAAGIHPLYALGASGSSPSAIVANTGATGRAVGNSMSQMGQNILQREQHQLQTQLMESQLRGSELANDAQAIANKGQMDTLNARAPKDLDAKDKTLKTGMGDITFSPDWDSAQTASDRYGDIVEALYGIGVLGADALKSYETWKKNRKPYKAPRSRQTGRTVPSRYIK